MRCNAGLAGERRQHGSERLGVAALDVTVGDDQHDSGAAKPPGDEPGELQRGEVRPLHVLEDHDHRPSCPHPRQQVDHGAVQAKPAGRRTEHGGCSELPARTP
jgi:hypothetical protein